MPRREHFEPGTIFGDLKVCAFDGIRSGRAFWRCECICRGAVSVASDKLKSGARTNCGCKTKQLREQIARRMGRANTQHGLSMTKSPEYHAWRAMRSRCTNPKNREYCRYGGRGITVAQAWDSFEAFYEDMGTRPSSKHSLDRRNNNLGYSKENCRWVIAKTQARNRSDNTILTFRGESRPVSEWAERIGIKYGTILARLKRRWSVERTLNEPIHLEHRARPFGQQLRPQ